VIKIIKKPLQNIGIDGAIAFTLLSRIVQAGGGLVSIVFIAKFLSANEQGYYYTFASILAIQVFFELGLSGIITQYAAHEFSHLKWKDGELLGKDYYKSRLASLLRFCVKWFGIVSILLFFLLVGVGFCFFLSYNKGSGIEWQRPWILLCLATSLNLFIDPVLAFMDGIGEIKDMSKVRLIQKSVNVILLFIFFSAGFKLYSAALASTVSIIVNYVQMIFSSRKDKLKIIWGQQGEWVVNYVKEIFPYQWRIAMSWISGFFIFQLFNPVLFATDGAVVAGQMGMTLQVLNGISALSMSWINTKVPIMSSLIAQKEYKKLDTLFNKTLYNLAGANLVFIAVFLILLICCKFFNLPVANRFIPLFPLLILCVVTFVNQFVFSWATYLRCHKQEPFLQNSIVSAILCSLSTVFLGKYFGLMGIVSGYTTICIAVGLCWGYNIFKTKKLQWHQ